MKVQETIPASLQEGGLFTHRVDSWGQSNFRPSPRLSPTANSKKTIHRDSRGQLFITYALHKEKYVYIAIKSKNPPNPPARPVVMPRA